MSIRIDGTNTVANPGITGTDTDTGLQFGTDEVNIVTGGTTRTTVDSSGRLLVGTSTAFSSVRNAYESEATPTRQTYVATATNSVNNGFGIYNFSSSGYAPNLDLCASKNNTVGSHTIVSSDQALGHINFGGSDGTQFRVGATILAAADGTPSASDMPGKLVFSTTADGASSPTERMRIDSDGYLKASRDGSYFNVSENNHSFENSWDGNLIARLYHGGTSGNQYGLEITTANDQNNGTNHFFQCVGGSTVRARFKSSGGLSNYQANDTNLCDEREKKNIVDLDSTWDCLKKWELKKFHYNQDADTDDKKYGVIAQQIAPHCPEVIDDWVKQEAKEAVLDDDGNVVTPAQEEIVRMGVKEQQMYWMAIKALQEAQTRIEQLETRVAQLEGGTN